MSVSYLFTSESVTEGHPDKVCDAIADSVLDACLAQDINSRVACEVLCKANQIVLAGEITTQTRVDFVEIARNTVRDIGYDDPHAVFCADTAHVHILLSRQAGEIAQGVAHGQDGDQGAGDQGLMFGYATDETSELMPLPILLAHRLAQGLAEDRHLGKVAWLRPDGKTQVTVEYRNGRPERVVTVVVSAQHAADMARAQIIRYVTESLAPRVLGEWYHPEITFHVNPTGSFVQGGPEADCGVTGRKIMADSYGGMGRHGGGAFSGKDPSKVDRSAAYFCRFVARQVVRTGLALRAEVQVAYAIGVSHPVSLTVETFGTGNPQMADAFVRTFDFRPAAIIERLGLLRPFYRQTTNYGHFGKPDLPWEQ